MGLLRDQSLRPGEVREREGRACRPPAAPALISPPWKAPHPPAPSGRLPHAPCLLPSLHGTEDRPHGPGGPHCPRTGRDGGVVPPAGPALREPGGSPHTGHRRWRLRVTSLMPPEPRPGPRPFLAHCPPPTQHPMAPGCPSTNTHGDPLPNLQAPTQGVSFISGGCTGPTQSPMGTATQALAQGAGGAVSVSQFWTLVWGTRVPEERHHRAQRLDGETRSVVPDSARPHGLQPARLLCPWDSPGQNTGVGSPSLLQGIFPTQGSNPGLLHWQVYSLPSIQHPPPNLYPPQTQNVPYLETESLQK